jgi:hypothetical protein
MRQVQAQPPYHHADDIHEIAHLAKPLQSTSQRGYQHLADTGIIKLQANSFGLRLHATTRTLISPDFMLFERESELSCRVV